MSFHVTHPNLTKYVETKNAWDRLMRKAGRPSEPKLYDLRNLTAASKARLMSEIECDLSPENLTCDGELTGTKLRQRAAYLKAVKTELESI